MQQSAKQMLFFILLALAFLLIFSGLIISNASGKSRGALAVMSSAAGKGSQQLNHFNSAVTIERYEKTQGDILVSNGDLTIEGEVYGDAYVFYGNVILKNSALVYGHVTVYQGEIFENSGAKVAGDLLEIYGERTKYTKRRDIRGINKNIIRYTRKRIIRRNEYIDGNVVVQKGDVSIQGEINGDVLAIDGKVKLSSRALVIGHIITVKETAYLSKGARCTGEVIALNLTSERRWSNWDQERRRLDSREEEIWQRVESKYLKSKDEGIFRFFGDVTVHPNELIDGAVVVMKGKITLEGEVKGDVIAVFGDIEMGPHSFIDGDVVSVGGKIRREPGSTVTGDVVETSLRGVHVVNRYINDKDVRTKKHPPSKITRQWTRIPTNRYQRNFEDNDAVKFRYNRVEGLFLGLQMPRDYWWKQTHYNVALYGHLGYGFSNKEMRYQLGLERWFFDDLRITLGGQIYDLTETQDDWLIPDLENSLAALFIKEDFQDFYRRQGYCAYVKQNLTPAFEISAEYRVDQFYNMDQVTQWAVFGGHKKFFPNPAIDEFEALKSLVARVCIDTRNDRRHPSQGWYISFEGQFAGPRLNLNNEAILPATQEIVDFDRYILDIRRYQPLGYGENLDLRLRAGSARGVLPQQFLFDMGGFSSLRGYDYKYFQNGDRLLLANLEYRIHGRRTSFHDIWLFEHFNIILFADAGLLWNSEQNQSYQEGFDHLTLGDLKTDLGIALTNHDGDIRLNFAKRTDIGNQPVVVTFRINRAF